MENKNDINLDLTIEILEKEGYILNSMSLNEWVYQKENIQVTVNRLI